MKARTIIIGLILIILGVGIYIYYDLCVKPDKEARELLTEGWIMCERGDKSSVNNAINIFAKIIAKYPGSRYVSDAYFDIGRCYEKIGLQRLAYLKYVYLIKSNKNLPDKLKKEILIRLAHINVLKQYSEEAINQLYSLLNVNYNKEFRSRIYSELGYTYLKQKDYTKAKRMFDISLNEYGSNEDAILGRARTLKLTGKDNDAYDLYESFLKYYGAVSQYTFDVRKSYKEQAYNSGLNSFRNNHYNAAISFFGRVLANFPNDKISENALYWTGESYFALAQFDMAVSYFNRALSNNYYHKDQDSRIKKGYSYFMSKRFDLAAREFNIYLQQYPNGKYAPIANNWKDMSTKELLFRIQTKKLPEAKEMPKAKEDGINEAPGKESQEKKDEELEEESTEEKDEEISGDIYDDAINGGRIELENVAEL